MSAPLPETLRRIAELKAATTAGYTKKRDGLAAAHAANATATLARSMRYAADLVSQERAIVAAKAGAAQQCGYYVPAEAKVALVIRIRGVTALDPRSRKILQLLRLRQKQNAVFVRLDKSTLAMLKKVEPYIAYGYPSPALVRELIFRCGYAAVNGQRLPLASNELIAAGLRQYGIESVEDLAHEIYTAGPNFTTAARFLWPFKLNQPKGGFRAIGKNYVEGGDYGNRENLIDDLVLRSF
jgi:large subunit ribosomal protein L7e